MPRRPRRPGRRGRARSRAPGRRAPAPRRRAGRCRDQRQIERVVACRARQPLRSAAPSSTDQREPGRCDDAAGARCRGRAPRAGPPERGRAGATPSTISTRSSATRSKPRASRRSTRSDLPAPGGPISSTPSPARLAQLPWICMTAQSGPVRAGKEARLSPHAGKCQRPLAMISRNDIAAAAAPDRAACPPHAGPSRRRRGAAASACPVTLKLELLQHAGSFKPRGAFNRMLSADAAGRRRDRGVGRQPWRGGRLCRPRARRHGGDLRPGADAGGEGRAHRQLWRARGADRRDLCRGAGRVARPPGGDRRAGGACLRPSGCAGRPGHGRAGVRAGRAGADACAGGDRRRRADRRHRRLVRRQRRGGQRRAGGLSRRCTMRCAPGSRSTRRSAGWPPTASARARSAR